MINHYHHSDRCVEQSVRSLQMKMRELEEHQITSWRQELAHKYQPFISISPEASVCEAVRRLTISKVHRLPVVDPISGNVVYIITHKRILKFVHLFVSMNTYTHLCTLCTLYTVLSYTVLSILYPLYSLYAVNIINIWLCNLDFSS